MTKANNEGKVWFITGSSRGLGRSLTEAVLAHGDQVTATARNPEQLNDLVKKYPGQIHSIKLDVTRYAEITHAVLPYMRKQRSGHILQISSVGGRVGNAGLTMYQAAKFGLGGFSEALAKEVAPLGIKVTCVEPGGFRTDWGGASVSFAPEVEGV